MTLHDVLSPSFLNQFRIVDWGYTENSKPLSFDRYENWVKKDGHGPLGYLADERKEKRKDVRNFFPEFQSSLVFLFSYAKEKSFLDSFYKDDPQANGLKLASYSLGFEGMDYHHVLRDSLQKISLEIKKIYPNCMFSHSLDIQPVLERDLAARAGLGWFGKNSMFISRQEGSFVMLGSLFLSTKLPLNEGRIETDHCGTCTRCIDLCPTQAIDPETRTLQSEKCISTFTIELFKEDKVAPLGMEKANGEIFGCDICQDVCPWNKKTLQIEGIEGEDSSTKPLKENPLFNFFLKRPKNQIKNELEGMSNREFRRVFKGTAVERTGRKSLLKNINFWEDSIS